MTSRKRLLLSLVLTTFVANSGAVFAQEDASGHWEGEIEIPGMPLQIKIDLQPGSDAWSGTIDIPAQNTAGLPLSGIVVDGAAVRFTIEGVPGNPTFDGTLEGEAITGTFQQAAAKFPFTLGRDAVEPAKRPQEPTEPLPYGAEEVTYTNGDITLAGTLTLPAGEGPHPAAVLITGSGAQDRNEALLGHKPFLVLSDHLTRSGYAVLRSDDRGVGGSSGDPATATSADFAGDVQAAVSLLAADGRIDADGIGLIGHSEGGIIAPMVAARAAVDDNAPQIAFVVSLSGTGVPGGEILQRQLELIAKANGGDQALIERQLELQREILDILRSDAPDEERRERLEQVVEQQIGLQGPAEGEALEATREAAVRGVLTPWFEYFIDHDPAADWRRTRVPTLLLNGSLDLQVDAHQNLPVMVAALLEAGNDDFTVQVLPRLNHLFQTSETGSPDEYAMIEETFAPLALEAITHWLAGRFPPAAD